MERNVLNKELLDLEFDPEMDFEGPIQPKRCALVTTLYEKPTFEQFVLSVKKWIRTCVQEGREHTLLNGNYSLRAVWDELMSMPVSMDLVNGRKIDVLPRYEWQRTPGYPYWRATKITFHIIRKKKTSLMPTFNIPDPIPVPPDPVKIDPPKPEPGVDFYYYCSKAGVKLLKVKKGTKPVPPTDALSPFYTDLGAAMSVCKPSIYIPWMPQPGNTTTKKDDDFDLGPLVKVLALFGAVIFFGKGSIYFKAVYELYQIQKFVKSLYPGQDVKFHLNTDDVKKTLSVLIEKNGNAQLIDKFFDDLLKNRIISQSQYDQYKLLLNDLLVKLQELNAYRNQRFLRAAGHWVRGYFIEDIYIQRQLIKQGYVGLPNWFKGYDAYYQASKFTVRRTLGKYITTYDNPGLISIKSYAPKGGLKNISTDYVKKQLMESWIPKMNFKEFERENIKIVNPRQKELHLILVGEEEKGEFIQHVSAIKKIFSDAKVVLKISQYNDALGLFLDL